MGNQLAVKNEYCFTRSTDYDRDSNYLNAEYGWKSWLFTTDHKRIAVLYLISITRDVLPRRHLRRADPAGAADAAGRPGQFRHLQQVLHHARDHHGVLLPDPVHPGHARQFPGPHDDRRQGPGVPAHQPAELVHLHRRRDLRAGRGGDGRRGHRLDLLYAVQQHLFEHLRHHGRLAASSSPGFRPF